MITWQDRSNPHAPQWWALTIVGVMRIDVSREGAESWRVAISWYASERARDRFDLPAHWTADAAKLEALRFVAPRLGEIADAVSAAARDVADAVKVPT